MYADPMEECQYKQKGECGCLHCKLRKVDYATVIAPGPPSYIRHWCAQRWYYFQQSRTFQIACSIIRRKRTSTAKRTYAPSGNEMLEVWKCIRHASENGYFVDKLKEKSPITDEKPLVVVSRKGSLNLVREFIYSSADIIKKLDESIYKAQNLKLKFEDEGEKCLKLALDANVGGEILGHRLMIVVKDFVCEVENYAENVRELASDMEFASVEGSVSLLDGEFRGWYEKLLALYNDMLVRGSSPQQLERIETEHLVSDRHAYSAAISNTERIMRSLLRALLFLRERLLTSGLESQDVFQALLVASEEGQYRVIEEILSWFPGGRRHRDACDKPVDDPDFDEQLIPVVVKAGRLALREWSCQPPVENKMFRHVKVFKVMLRHCSKMAGKKPLAFLKENLSLLPGEVKDLEDMIHAFEEFSRGKKRRCNCKTKIAWKYCEDIACFKEQMDKCLEEYQLNSILEKDASARKNYNKLSKARKCAEECMRVDPKWAQGCITLANILNSLCEYHRAKTKLAEAKRLAQEDPRGVIEQGGLLRYINSTESQIEKAAAVVDHRPSVYERCYKYNPSWALMLSKKNFKKAKQDSEVHSILQEAKGNLIGVLSLDPSHESDQLLKIFKSIEDDVNDCLIYDESWIEAHHLKVNLFTEWKRHAEAAVACRTGLEFHPQDDTLWKTLNDLNGRNVSSRPDPQDCAQKVLGNKFDLFLRAIKHTSEAEIKVDKFRSARMLGMAWFASLIYETEENILKECWTSELSPQSVNVIERYYEGDTHQCAVVCRGDVIVLAFRGTKILSIDSHWIHVNFRQAPHPYKDNTGNVIGKVPFGFYHALDCLWCDIDATLKKLGAYDTDARKQIWTTGHSLGGAMASICALRLMTEKELVVQHVVTFGSPRVFCKDLKAHIDKKRKEEDGKYRQMSEKFPTDEVLVPANDYIRIFMQSDPVPDVSPSYCHMGDEFSDEINTATAYNKLFLSKEKPLRKHFIRIGNFIVKLRGVFKTHDMDWYLEYLLENYEMAQNFLESSTVRHIASTPYKKETKSSQGQDPYVRLGLLEAESEDSNSESEDSNRGEGESEDSNAESEDSNRGEAESEDSNAESEHTNQGDAREDAMSKMTDAGGIPSAYPLTETKNTNKYDAKSEDSNRDARSTSEWTDVESPVDGPIAYHQTEIENR